MFKELGAIAGLMKNLPKLKSSMEEMQQKLGQLTTEGTAGAGMVTVKINGRQELLTCAISPEAMLDREVLEDLIVAAVNSAMTKMNLLRAEETSKLANDLGMPLPAGMGLPF